MKETAAHAVIGCIVCICRIAGISRLLGIYRGAGRWAPRSNALPIFHFFYFFPMERWRRLRKCCAPLASKNASLSPRYSWYLQRRLQWYRVCHRRWANVESETKTIGHCSEVSCDTVHVICSSGRSEIALADLAQLATFGYSGQKINFSSSGAVACTVTKCCKFDSFTMPPLCQRESGRPVQFLFLIFWGKEAYTFYGYRYS